jgi:hypothetical protein
MKVQKLERLEVSHKNHSHCEPERTQCLVKEEVSGRKI